MSNNYNQIKVTTRTHNSTIQVSWWSPEPVLVVKEGVIDIVFTDDPQRTIYFPFNYHNNNLVYKTIIKDTRLERFKEYKGKHRDKISRDFLNNINK